MQDNPLETTSIANSRTHVCCAAWRSPHRQRCITAALLATTVMAILVAVYFAGVARQAARTSSPLDGAWQGLPIANATAAVSSERFSMCTGPLADTNEALFVLDHNSGLLQCSVLYPRVGRFMASYTVNVADALGMEAKGGSYMMVTGTSDFLSASNRPIGRSVIYVLDTTTGNYACYGVPINQNAMKANQPQQGVLFLISQGAANPVIDRDKLR
ncbi:hypothetical protein [Allorhodopirellula heiligendammensis]|uniref:Uncharacterized protein n=1 Tax=Allorhodopirellula heiligendammensis TaxID=2714739 RepID=A0A5C6BTR9_9BACT|nr:hypothetical protein [Allorhodopirellula heiligendammensis]TWU15067.1 hypothetical protein Poly21_22590 [Allorhodopirellula heiligendammensis]